MLCRFIPSHSTPSFPRQLGRRLPQCRFRVEIFPSGVALPAGDGSRLPLGPVKRSHVLPMCVGDWLGAQDYAVTITNDS